MIYEDVLKIMEERVAAASMQQERLAAAPQPYHTLRGPQSLSRKAGKRPAQWVRWVLPSTLFKEKQTASIYKYMYIFY